MPIQKELYPHEWPEISRLVRDAADNRCERCHVENGSYVFRSIDGRHWYDSVQDCYFEWPTGELMPDWFEADMRDKGTKIVLTVAHVGPNKHDKSDCSSLEALCQACHLAEDFADHVANGKRTRMSRKAGGSLFDTEETMP